MYQVNDILYQPSYCKILKKIDVHEYEVEDMYTHTRYILKGETLLDLHKSSLNFISKQLCTRTELIKKFLETKNGDVFTIGFIKKDETLRILRGRYVDEDVYFGYTRVIDFDKNLEIRLVDHRTLQFLIVNNTLYFNHNHKNSYLISEIDKFLNEYLNNV